MTSAERADCAIAIVGYGGVLPSSPALEDFWQHVLLGRDTARAPPPGRWVLEPARAHRPERGIPDRVYAARGCFVDPLPDWPPGLLVSAAELEGKDASYRLLLAAAAEAWRPVARARLDLCRVGAVIGHLALPTTGTAHLSEWLVGYSRPPEPPSAIERFALGLPAGLLMRALGLGGSHLVIDAACASSLFAVALACEELLAGRADAMLAGGVGRPDHLYAQMGFSQLFALSPSGRCAPFDEGGDGLVVGEGAGVFVLKRLADAIRDGDSIHAVVRGAGWSNDTDGALLAPSSSGQLRALRAAYRAAGWRPSDVELVECHATGTPKGDATELHALRTLWQEDPGGRAAGCVLSSVKSNVGHLLTAAGAAGLIKVLRAMACGVLPPTANFARAAPALELAGSPFRVLRSAEEWPRRQAPRRAAVSGFGFGGTNAHLLLEEWRPDQRAPAARRVGAPAAPSPVVRADTAAVEVIGVGVLCGPLVNAEEVAARLLGGEDGARPAAKVNHWGPDDAPTGWFIEQLAVPLGDFRIPPRELLESTPQQVLMLLAARRALEDAALLEHGRLPAELGLRTGVVIGIALEPTSNDFHLRWAAAGRTAQAAAPGEAALDRLSPALNANRTIGSLGGIVASRIAREIGAGGPAFVVSSEEASGLSALAVAQQAIARGDVDVMVIGAVDVQGDPRTVSALRALGKQAVLGDGAAALVLRRAGVADPGRTAYALVRAVGAATGGDPLAARSDASAYERAVRTAWREAGFPGPPRFDWIEGQESGDPIDDAIERVAWRALGGEGVRASARLRVGHTGAAAAAVSLVRVCLALERGVVPVPFREGPAAGHFLRPEPWIAAGKRVPRRAAVCAGSSTGAVSCAVVEEPPAQRARTFAGGTPLGALHEGLFLLGAENREQLGPTLDHLAALAGGLPGGDLGALDGLARRHLRGQPERARCAIAVGLVARTPSELQQRCLQAVALIAAGRGAELPAASAGRAFFGARGVRPKAEVAFVYPGLGSSVEGMGRALLVHFPHCLRALEARFDGSLRGYLQPELLWRGAKEDLAARPADLILGQAGLGCALAAVLEQCGVVPGRALGYSLGESTALLAHGVWGDPAGLLERFRASDLFTEQLAGPHRALRRLWRLAADEPVAWLVGLLATPAQTARERVRALGLCRTYVLIANTPGECVVGGDRLEVERLARELALAPVVLAGVPAVHCPAVAEVGERYAALHRQLVEECPEDRQVHVYSAASGEVMPRSAGAVSAALTAQAVSGFDFGRLVTNAYRDGVRCFVEVGPGSGCTRMIGQILGGQAHTARALLPEGNQAAEPFLRTLAALWAEGVAVRLAPLFGARAAADPPPDRRQRVELRVGRPGRGAAAAADAPAPATAGGGVREPAVMRGRVDSRGVDLVTAGARAAAVVNAHAVGRESGSGESVSLQQKPRLPVPHEPRRPPERRHDQPAAAARLAPRPASVPAAAAPVPRALGRALCLEFARGRVAAVFGPEFAPADGGPSRVRLPDEPLMLVDSVVRIEGEPRSLRAGRIVTRHRVNAQSWYLDGGRIPVGLAVEAGQADLLLSGFLGIDFATRGEAVYRLLDAAITWHDDLPGPDATIEYDITIERFFRHGRTWLFRFGFDATCDGRPLLRMRDGCAGFFTADELRSGRGLVAPPRARAPEPTRGARPLPQLAPVAEPLALDELQLEALRAGRLEDAFGGAFGAAFAGLDEPQPLTLPGGRLALFERVVQLDLAGGEAGLGCIHAESEIRGEEWFLACHFVDDPVMPGTLMYEACAQALRVLLLRRGLVAGAESASWQPLLERTSRLRCRGQVTTATRRVGYQVTVRELGVLSSGEPFAVADAVITADGRAIVAIEGLALRLAGVAIEELERRFAGGASARERSVPIGRSGLLPGPGWHDDPPFPVERIVAFADGQPSAAFGAAYRVFDHERRIARLPRDPYRFLDQVIDVSGAPFELRAGAECSAQFHLSPDHWTFAANRQAAISFAVLLEAALQPCGWLAAYCGSALRSSADLHFRNLGGEAAQYRPVVAEEDVLTTRVKLVEVAESGGVIIEHFTFDLWSRNRGRCYAGRTYFGFFTTRALSHQQGIRGAPLHAPSLDEQRRGRGFVVPHEAPFPDPRWRMVERVDRYVRDGGPGRLGFISGSIDVDPAAWFFPAHFKDDPVWPGSLGLEAFLQLLKCVAVDRFGGGRPLAFATFPLGAHHRWVYRGQIVPTDRRVELQAVVTRCDQSSRTIVADGFLLVDGRVIYELRDFAVAVLDAAAE